MHSIMTIAVALYAASLVVEVVFACCTQTGTPAVRAAFSSGLPDSLNNMGDFYCAPDGTVANTTAQ